MQGTKPWYASRGVIGPIIVLLCLILSTFGYKIEDADREALTNAVVNIGIAVGAILGIVGRVQATKRIGPAAKTDATGSSESTGNQEE